MAAKKVSHIGFEIEGITKIKRDLVKLKEKELLKDMRGAFVHVSKVIAETAKKEVPVRSGRLRKSIGVVQSQTSATVKAGTNSRILYAGPIHFGWKDRNIKPNKFLYRAVHKNREFIETYMSAALERIKRQHFPQ